MKKLFLYFALLSSCGSVLCMDSKLMKLPVAKVLNEKLLNKGLGYFVEKTKIDKKLGGEEMFPIGVVNAVDFALTDYVKDLPRIIAVQMRMNKPMIIEIILEGHPEAIEELKNMNLLQ